jgi:hypothetical protein
MKIDGVIPLNQLTGSLKAKAIRRTCYQDTGHFAKLAQLE